MNDATPTSDITPAALAGRKVLVTGAGGFIGSHLTEALVRAGADVSAMVRYGSNGSTGFLAEAPADIASAIRPFRGDITDPESVAAAVRGQEIVFHLAALIAIPYSYEAPRSYLRTNVEGTLNVLEAVRRFDVARMVHTSTSEVYGSARFVPMDETHPLQGQSPYSASKIGADKLAESYHLSFDVPVVTIRPFNTFGPRQSPRAVIPATIQQALWSDTVRLGATSPVRDMTFVDDTVSGFIHGAIAAGLEGGTFNLGTGTGYTVGEIAERIMRLAGRSDAIELDPARMRPAGSEVDRLISSHEAFTAASGWKPRVSLDEGLARCIEWFRTRGRPADPTEYVR